MPAVSTRHEINRLSNGHIDPKIQGHSIPFAFGAGNGFQAVGNIGLRVHIKFHVRVNRKRVIAIAANGFPFTVLRGRARIDPEPVRSTNGAIHLTHTLFDFCYAQHRHWNSFPRHPEPSSRKSCTSSV